MNEEQIDEILEELNDYANLDGTKLGGLCSSLIELYESYVDYVSDEFKTALVKEMQDQLQNFKENYKIVEEEWEVTTKKKSKELRRK